MNRRAHTGALKMRNTRNHTLLFSHSHEHGAGEKSEKWKRGQNGRRGRSENKNETCEEKQVMAAEREVDSLAVMAFKRGCVVSSASLLQKGVKSSHLHPKHTRWSLSNASFCQWKTPKTRSSSCACVGCYCPTCLKSWPTYSSVYAFVYFMSQACPRLKD